MLHRRSGFSAPWSRALVCLFCLAVSTFAVAQDSSTQNSSVTIDKVTVGVDSFYRVGYVTQVRVEVTSESSLDNVRLEVELPDGEGVQSVTVTEGLSLSPGTSHVEGFAKFGRVNSYLVVRLRSEETLLAEKRISADALPDAILATQQLVLSLGPDVSVSDAISLRHEKREQETIHGLIKDAALLPKRWLGYSGVSVVVLAGSDTGLTPQMTEQQLAALDQWVRLGGRLIFSCGANAESALGPNGVLARFAPGDFDRIQMQRETSGIENFVGTTTKSLDNFVSEGDLAFRIPMALLNNRRGTVIVAEGVGRQRTPLVVRASHGFGHTVFVAVDLENPPMSQWKDGRRRLVGKLLDISLGATEREESDSQHSQLSQIGFDDLTGQLRASLDQFTNVRLVPFSWIAVLIALYIALIGPLDYLFLRKLNQRFSWTWITFPVMVIAACALAYALTQYWKGETLRVNQVDIVDIDSRSGLLRGMTWGHLFSPTSRKYDLAVTPTNQLFPIKEPRGSIASWQGLPGKSFGGMNTSRVSQSADTYEIACDVRDDDNQNIQVSEMPIDVFASRSLSGFAWGQVELPKLPPLVADFENQLNGSITNPLNVDLRNCLLCYGRWVYPLGTIAAGGSKDFDRFSVKTIDGMLTRTKVDADFKDRSLAWDRKSLEVSRIMEMMMFHGAAGGSKYTSLLHRFQGEVDFSDHLNEGTALLIGNVNASRCKLIDAEDGQYETSTFVRILMPVTSKASNGQ